jgi:hypothetical protein
MPDVAKDDMHFSYLEMGIFSLDKDDERFWICTRLETRHTDDDENEDLDDFSDTTKECVCVLFNQRHMNAIALSFVPFQ